MDNAREETNPLNKYRTELMGASIILIMIFHSYDIIFPLKDIGQVGVDIFLFLSGTGCFYSFKKNKSITSFYWRRLIRIFPMYFLIVFFRILGDVLFDGYTVSSAIYNYSLISFFFSGNTATWYIAGLLLLYMIFPLMFFLLEKNDKIFLGIIVCYTLGMSIMPIISSRVELFSHSLNIFYIRVLPFMTGAYYAKKTFSGLFVREENLEKWKEYLLIGLTYLIVLFALNDRFNAFNTWKKLYIQRMIFFPLCIFVMFSLTLILKKKDYPFLSKFGKITLELYLLHEWLLHISRIIVFNYINENKLLAILLNIIMFFVSVLIASAIHRFFNAVLTREKAFASH